MITMAARKRKTASICPGMLSCVFWAGICWAKAGTWASVGARSLVFFGAWLGMFNAGLGREHSSLLRVVRLLKGEHRRGGHGVAGGMLGLVHERVACIELAQIVEQDPACRLASQLSADARVVQDCHDAKANVCMFTRSARDPTGCGEIVTGLFAELVPRACVVVEHVRCALHDGKHWLLACVLEICWKGRE